MQSLVSFARLEAVANLLTAPEVAERLRLDRETVCEMLRIGELRGFKTRGRWRIEEPDLEAYVERQMNTPLDRVGAA